MTQIKKRHLFTQVNKYQKPIVKIIACFSLISFVLILCASYLYNDTYQKAIDSAQEVSFLKSLILITLLILPLVLYLVIVSAYKMSSRLVGSFERILKELDTVIENRQKKHIQARANDELAGELLKRINTLIDRMS